MCDGNLGDQHFTFGKVARLLFQFGDTVGFTGVDQAVLIDFMFVGQFIYSIETLRYIIDNIHLDTGEIAGTLLIIEFGHFHVFLQFIGGKDGLVEREGETAVHLVAFQLFIIPLRKCSPVILPVHLGTQGEITAGRQDICKVQVTAHLQRTGRVVDRQTVGLRNLRQALRNRMEIKEDNLDIELQAIEVKRAKREREFKGNISAYYDFTGLSTRGDGTVGQLVGSSFDNMRDRPANRGIALTVSYPLLDWGRAKNQVRREQVRLKQRELNLDNTKRTIEQEIREIVRSVYEAEKRYRINRRNQEVAIQSYRISQMRFENGDMTSQELSIEQERLSQVQLAYIDSYITYRLSVADLNRKTMYDFEHNRSFLPEKG